jgi:hypothetical protein
MYAERDDFQDGIPPKKQHSIQLSTEDLTSCLLRRRHDKMRLFFIPWEKAVRRDQTAAYLPGRLLHGFLISSVFLNLISEIYFRNLLRLKNFSNFLL